MLISFSKLYFKYCLEITGIIHVGAHLMEEEGSYLSQNIDNIIWIEGNPELYERKRREVNGKQRLYNYIISNNDDEEVSFYVANNGMSSSILEFGSHSEDYPDIKYVEEKKMITHTLKSVMDLNSLQPSDYNFINLDIQGVELRALKGYKDYLKNIDYIYTEVNIGQVYRDNDLMKDIDAFLGAYGFVRVETVITKNGWGDAFYTRKSIPSLIHRTLANIKFPKDTLMGIIHKAFRLFTSIKKRCSFKTRLNFIN